MEFPALTSRKSLYTYCCVQSCKSSGRTLRFHKFPIKNRMVKIKNNNGIVEEMSLQKAWKMKLMINKEIKKHMTVCSLHFSEEDYSCIGYSHKRYLNSTAVPSRNLPENKQMKMKEEELSQDDYSCIGYSHKRYLNSTAVPSRNLPDNKQIRIKEEDLYQVETETECTFEQIYLTEEHEFAS